MGVIYVVVVVEYLLVIQVVQNDLQLQVFIDECKCGGVVEVDIVIQEKKGMVIFLFVEYLLIGDKLLVWVVNYVLMNYGEGVVMVVFGYDECDFEFVNKYGLLICQVIVKVEGDNDFEFSVWKEWYGVKDEFVFIVNFGKYDNFGYQVVFDVIGVDFEVKGLGQVCIQFCLCDWGISCQCYWGCLILIIYCEVCGDVLVLVDQLLVVLLEDVVLDGFGLLLVKMLEFYECNCLKCGQLVKCEIDIMDIFVELFWYFVCYVCLQFEGGMLDRKVVDYWLLVDQYIGGIEYVILYLFYVCFFYKLMCDEGLVGSDELFKNLLIQGMVVVDIYYWIIVNGGKDWFNLVDVEVECDVKVKVVGVCLKSDGQLVEIGGIEKMLKLKNNGVDL